MKIKKSSVIKKKKNYCQQPEVPKMIQKSKSVEHSLYNSTHWGDSEIIYRIFNELFCRFNIHHYIFYLNPISEMS